jgi:hypothetical protein
MSNCDLCCEHDGTVTGSICRCFLRGDLDFQSLVGNGSHALDRFRVGMKPKLRELPAVDDVPERDYDLAATTRRLRTIVIRYVIRRL